MKSRNNLFPFLILFLLSISLHAQQDFYRDIDASFTKGDYTYFFKGDEYVKYNHSTKMVDAGYPKKIKSPTGFIQKDKHNYFSSNLGAAIYWGDGRVYFFKGDKYLRYDWGEQVSDSYPSPISGNWKNFHWSNIDAAVCYKNGGSKRVFFFRGSEYIEYIGGEGVSAGYPKKINVNWKNTDLKSINAAITLTTSSYLFRGTEYAKYPAVKQKGGSISITSGYPSPIRGNWYMSREIDESRFYYIATKRHSNMVLDAGTERPEYKDALVSFWHRLTDDSSTKASYEDNLIIWSKNDSDAQQFRFELAGYENNDPDKPLYYIRAKRRKGNNFNLKSIDVYDFQTDNKSSVKMWDANTNKNQKFRVKDEGNGYFTFSPAHVSEGSMYLDLYSGESEAGSPILLYSRGGNSDNRMFRLIRSNVKVTGADKINKISTSNWMKDIEDDTPMGKITIPGTHDSGTNRCYSSLARCQEENISTQLERGIRYLDIRLRVNKLISITSKDRDFILVHDECITSYSFEQCLRDCKKFLDQHPTETIVMRVADNIGNLGEDLNITKPYFKFVFDQVISRVDGLKLYGLNNEKNLFNTKLSEVRGRIVILDNSPGESSLNGAFVYDKGGSRGSDASNDYSIDGNASRAVRVMREANSYNQGSNNTALFIVDPAQNGFSGSGTDIAETLILKTKTPFNYARKANKEMYDFLIRNDTGSYGVIALDFPWSVDGAERLVEKLILSNGDYFKN